MRYILITAICLLLGPEAFTQDPRPGGQRPMGDPQGIVKGTVYDNTEKIPMEYANIVLFRVRDSSMVTGTVTKPDGSFMLREVPFGRFYMAANFIGYNRKTISDIFVTPKKKETDIGKIFLEPAAASLEGVEITAEKKHVEYRIDKKIVNVSQDIMTSGYSAIAVLENTPSVQVDIEGNVSLRGTSNFRVLIDGRPSILDGSDALQQIPASTIDHIEIITNPSAKYDPDGVGGIINVVLKKQKRPGTNGIINASASTGDKYEADIQLNHRTGIVNLFAGADLNYRDYQMEGSTKYETYLEDTTNFRNTEIDGVMNRNGYRLRGGLDIYLTGKSTLTASGEYGKYGFSREHSSNRHIFTQPVTTDEFARSESESSREGNYYDVNLSYTNKFDDKGHQLELLGIYSKRTGDDWDEQKDYDTDAQWNIIDSIPEFIRTTEIEENNDFRIKADYTRPVGSEGRAEAGYQSRFDFENEKFLFLDFDYGINEWVENDLYSSEMDFTRNIHSIYGIYSNTWKSFGYQVGLRGEYTDRRIENPASEEAYIIDRFDYFPTLHLSKQFEGDQQVLASYSRRIDRPRGRQLDPFVNYMDPFNARQGNPGLEPEYIDSWELSYQKRIRRSFVALETYYRINKNKITRIKRLQDDGAILHTYQNLNRDFALGAELMVNGELGKWLTVNGSVNVFDYRLEGNVEEEDVSVSSTNWNSRLNITAKLPADFRTQLTGFYRGPSITAQGEREGYFMMNLAVRKDFFGRKLSATVSVRDVFATAQREMITRGENFYSYDLFRREAPIVTFSLSYLINNYKRERNGERQGEGQDNGDFDMDF